MKSLTGTPTEPGNLPSADLWTGFYKLEAPKEDSGAPLLYTSVGLSNVDSQGVAVSLF